MDIDYGNSGIVKTLKADVDDKTKDRVAIGQVD